jgi:hypothetical protein
MPDWKKLVRERLASSELQPYREEVVSELAAHLEETFEVARSQGRSEVQAVELALHEVEDWHVLSNDIQRAKSQEGPMNHRTKSLWMPALITLLGASALLMLIQFAGFQPRLVWIEGAGVTLYWHWLAGLPAFGALGPYLSRRARGTTWARLAAGLSPALAMLITMCLLLPWGLAIDGLSFLRWIQFGIMLLIWVLFPALSLLLGTLPFLGSPRHTETISA